jgi:signal transduction histidine kinase
MPLAHDILLLHEAGPDRQALASYLERQGLTTTVCEETRQALAHLDGRRPARRVVVLAHQKRIAAAPRAAIDALRTHPSVLIVPAGSEPIPGFDDVVREPFFLDQLLGVLERTASRGAAAAAETPPAQASKGEGQPGELLRGISHALNNPLTAALGWLRLLETEIDGGARTASLAAQARSELERLSQFSQGLALVAAPPPPDSVFDLAPLVATRVHAAVSAGARVSFRPARSGTCPVAGNSGEIDVLLRLFLDAAHESQSIEPLEVAIDSAKGFVRLEVRDPRAALPDKDAIRDLGRLFRLERHQRALAIALAHSIARRAGGTLHCAALEPRGASFVLSIPEASAGREAAQGAS